MHKSCKQFKTQTFTTTNKDNGNDIDNSWINNSDGEGKTSGKQDVPNTTEGRNRLVYTSKKKKRVYKIRTTKELDLRCY